MIQDARVTVTNTKPTASGQYVLYWMQQAQRVQDNHALEYAIERANDLGLPVVVVFGLTDAYPEANERHYAFMLEGLTETKAALARRGICMVVRQGSPDDVALLMANDAALVVVDRGYLRVQRRWRRHVSDQAPCSVVEVESDAIVPVETASDHEEYAARTLRPKLHRLLASYLVPVAPRRVHHTSLDLKFESLDIDDPQAVLQRLQLDRTVRPTPLYRGGAREAQARLDRFIEHRLSHYGEGRNDPANDYQSDLSPYLHFGQISPLRIALAVSDAAAGRESSAEALLEELIVRRELSLNFVHFNRRYDAYDALPEWALATLEKHRSDARDYLYTEDELTEAATHDPYWNAAMTEMAVTGKMHGYMRMYWGKKILEWSVDARTAFETALRLNNRYFLDGRDANSYAGVAWLFGKHDRPWGERPIFGTVRYMNAKGLERKFDMPAYVRRVAEMTR